MKKTVFFTATALILASCSQTKPQVSSAALPDSVFENVLNEVPDNALNQQIINGVESRRGGRPYQALVMVPSADGKGAYLCGGTIISKDWILTAAHCLTESTSIKGIVRVGVHDRKASPKEGQQLSISNYYLHPSYRANAKGFDIALIKLSGSINHVNAKAAMLPNDEVEAKLDVHKARAVVSGWGRMKSSGGTSDVLREASIPISPTDRCGSGNRPANTICGLPEDGKDSCQGDSGGPLAQSYNGKFYVLGVVSYGPAACNGNGVYTRVNGYLDWIAQVSGVKAEDSSTPAPTPTPTPDPTPDPEPTPTPDTGSYTYSGRVIKGTSEYAPQDGFTLSAATTLRGELSGPDSADFDLYLEKSNGYYWIQVAKSTKFNKSNESISYNASAGQYRWRVRAWNGSGEATLVQTPRGTGQR